MQKEAAAHLSLCYLSRGEGNAHKKAANKKKVSHQSVSRFSAFLLKIKKGDLIKKL